MNTQVTANNMSVKHFTLESHLKAVTKDEGLWNIWKQAKEDIPKVLSQIPLGFPNYSMHDESHSRKIIETIELLLGGKGIETLSAIDTFMLLMSAYSHDLGMYLSYTRLIEEFLMPESQRELDSLTRHRDRVVSDAAQLIKYNLADIKKDKNVWIHALEINNAIRILTSQLMRNNHADRSYDYILNNDEIGKALHLDNYSRIKKSLAIISHLHGTDFQQIFMELKQEENSIMEHPGKYHPRFVACMIRLGDLLDVSENRFNAYTIQQIKELPEISVAHQQKHECIESLNICRERICATFNCPNDAVYRVVSDWYETLYEELKEQRLHWEEIAPNELILFYHLPPSTKKGKDGIEILFHGVSGISPELMNLRFDISSQRTFEMLKGGSIYKNSGTVFIREIVQNALDATKLQIWKDIDIHLPFCLQNPEREIKTSNDIYFSDDIPDEVYGKYPIDLKVDFDVHNQSIIVSCEDWGTGISEESLIRMTSQVGASRKADKDYEKTIDRMPFFLQPTSAFGLGLQTVFYVANEFTIDTHYPGEPTRRIVFRTSANGSYCSIEKEGFDFSRNKKKVTHGTTVKIIISYKQWGNLLNLKDDEVIRIMDNPESLDYFIPKVIDDYIKKTFNEIEKISFHYSSPYCDFTSIKKQDSLEEHFICLLDEKERFRLYGRWIGDRDQNGNISHNINLEFLLEEIIHGSRIKCRFISPQIYCGELMESCKISLKGIPLVNIRIPFSFVEMEWDLYNRTADPLVTISRDNFTPKGERLVLDMLEELMPEIIRLTHGILKESKLLHNYYYLCLTNWSQKTPVNEVNYDTFKGYKRNYNYLGKPCSASRLFEAEEIVIIRREDLHDYENHSLMVQLIKSLHLPKNNKTIIADLVSSYSIPCQFTCDKIAYKELEINGNIEIIECLFLRKDSLCKPHTVSISDNDFKWVDISKTIYGFEKYKEIVVDSNAPSLGKDIPAFSSCWIFPIYDYDNLLTLFIELYNCKGKEKQKEILHSHIHKIVPAFYVGMIQKHSILHENITQEEIYDTYVRLIIDHFSANNSFVPYFEFILNRKDTKITKSVS